MSQGIVESLDKRTPRTNPAGRLRMRVATAHAARLENRLYRVAYMTAWWILAALVVVAFVQGSTATYLLLTSTAVIYAMSALGLSWLMGRAGLVSIGNGALMAVGGFITAISSAHAWGTFPVPIVLSALGGLAVGALIGLPALRLRGIYLALATLALQFFVVFAADQYQRHKGLLTGVPVSPLTIGGTEFSYGRNMVYLLFVFLGLSIIIVKMLFRQGPGRMWGAIRESELAASVVGVNIARWKLAAFVGSSMMIAVSGSLLAYYTQIVSADTYTLDFSITFIVMIIIGGVGTISGALVGATIVTALPHVLTWITGSLPSGFASDWFTKNIFYLNNALYGILVLLFLLFRPEGIAPSVASLGRWLLNRVAPLPVSTVAPAPSVGETAPRSKEAGRGGSGETIPPASGTRGGREVLRVDDLTVTYRTGARAVDGVSLRVEEHQIVAILGRNGAGKTSTLRSISGFLKTEGVRLGGRVRMGDVDLLGRSPAQASKLAVLVPERDKIFPDLTVAEHLRVVRGSITDPTLESDPTFSRLWERSNLPAGLLSGGERQLLALAAAWQLKPALMMVDEFTLGLSPVMIRRVSDVIRRLRDEQNMTFLVVEQNAAAALDLADWVYVMEGGRIVAEGAPSDMAGHDLMRPIETAL